MPEMEQGCFKGGRGGSAPCDASHARVAAAIVLLPIILRGNVTNLQNPSHTHVLWHLLTELVVDGLQSLANGHQRCCSCWS